MTILGCNWLNKNFLNTVMKRPNLKFSDIMNSQLIITPSRIIIFYFSVRLSVYIILCLGHSALPTFTQICVCKIELYTSADFMTLLNAKYYAIKFSSRLFTDFLMSVSNNVTFLEYKNFNISKLQ
jgi:hypothetical protein